MVENSWNDLMNKGGLSPIGESLNTSGTGCRLAVFLVLGFFWLLAFFPMLRAQTAENPLDVPWDEGTEDSGTQVARQPSSSPGKYYFRISTKSSEVWRTRLTVTSGEAHLYLRRGQIPVIGQADVKMSDATGSDGLALAPSDFAPGENWYLMVDATGVSNSWSLVSGAPHVTDLGELPFTDANQDGSYTIGEATQNAGVSGQTVPPEGVVFYKMTLPVNVPAWALWLDGSTGAIGVRKSKVPVLFAASAVADRKQNGSLLLVPPYLGQGSDSYFVSVLGTPGSQITLNSRIQPVETITYNAALPPFSPVDSPYKVFKIDVPSGQIAWDVALNRVSGDPSLAIKKETVPCETENDAVNEAAGEVNDSISIVAPALTNGTWFVTVYGTGAYETGLTNGPPQITDIGYRDEVINDQPLRAGWRYYRVPDFTSQVGTLGWELALTNAPTGTEIALRRAQIPGIWKKRSGGSTTLSEVKYTDASSKNGILQRVDHEADIWYVGVYQPSLPLGNFRLTLNDIQSTPISLDGTAPAVEAQVEGTWKYYRVQVPEDAKLLGWYLNLSAVSGTVSPKITVRRDRLPPSGTSVTATSSTWPTGASWSQDADFTGQMMNPSNVAMNGRQFLAARGANRPLVPGTYYIGVLAGAATPATGTVKTANYTLQSQGIGEGYSIGITSLTAAGGSNPVALPAARNFQFFKINIPAGLEVPCWQIDLTPSSGEMLMQVRRDSIPDFSTSVYVGETPGSSVGGGKRLKRTGGESLLLLPENGATTLQSGDYYVAVVSEGLSPSTTIMGEGAVSGTLTSTIPASITQLGAISATAPVTLPITLKGGNSQILRFSVPAGMKVLEAFLTDRSGNPGISIARGTAPPIPFPGTSSGNNGYGWVGGQTTSTHPVLVTVQDPVASEYTIVVRANAESSTLPDAAFTLNLHLVENLPVLNPVSGADTAIVTEQIAESWRYFELTVPEDARLKGIRVTLKNVTSGVPRMVIRKGTAMPKDFTTSNGLNSNGTSWPAGQQWGQTNDFSGIQYDSTGTIAAGRYFLAAYNAPMDPGTYIIGVTKDTSVNTVTQPNTPTMSYTVVAESIGDGLDLPVTGLAFDNTTSPETITALPEREMKFYKVTIPAGKSSWRVHLRESLTGDAPPKVQDGAITIRRGNIPAFDSAKDPHNNGGATAKLLAIGDHWVLLPTTADGLLESGEYFIAVTSLGTAPTTTKTGADPSTLTLFSRGEISIAPFPSLSVETAQSLPYQLGPAEVTAFDFTIPARAATETPYGLVLDLLRDSGAANYSLLKLADHGNGHPIPPGAGNDGFFGGLAPLAATTDDIGGKVFAEISPGSYRVLVRSSQKNSTYTNATGRLSAKLQLSSDIPQLLFDGENLTVTNAGTTTDILQFRVEIPDEPNWQAWGIRLDGPIVGKPAIIVRRNLPVESATGNSVNSDLIDWPLGYQWSQSEDFTKLKNDPSLPASNLDRDRSQQFFIASREHPLQPGTYFIGIDNRGTAILPRTFTLRTFAVGDGYSVPITDLSSPGAQATIDIATPRMPAVFKITVPPLTRAWAVSLSPTLGDLTLRARHGIVPDPINDPTYPDAKGGVHIQKSGDERLTLLPKLGTPYLLEGDYFLLAASEGQNSSMASSLIGTDSVQGTIRNEGPVAITNLGTVSDIGITQPVSLAAAEIQCYTVNIPAGINNLEFRLRDRSGEANLAILRGTQIPAPGITESYGVFGGETAGSPTKDRSIINLGNPTPGTYTIVVRAAGTLPSSYAPASATLTINVLKPAPLNFAEEQNIGNGLSNVDARTLSDKEKFSYRIPIPRQINGEDVLGWLITLEQGSPTVRIYKSESDFGKIAPVTMVGRSALIVPPFLTFDANWFIEVEGVGTSDYILRSQPVRLTAPAWSLPTTFNQLAGDSNPGSPDGQSIRRELPQDAWEFFAIDVPENNLGLLRLALEQYAGNPNVYIRQQAIPSIDHLSTGATGNKLFHYKMIAETSETGNFSELSHTASPPERLTPGRWFIGVKSEPVGTSRTGSGYRLKAHSGVVTDVDLTTTAPLTNQNLAERDWRYYRFTIPRTGIPTEWKPFFNRISGGSTAYLRDTLPPFSYVLPTATTATSPSFVDWSSDAKNKVPTATYVKNISPGTISLASPPLRPGSTYFLGIYGSTSGGSVEVSSSVSSAPLTLDAELPYNLGSSTLTVPANSSRLVRITTAPDATRLKIDCRQSATGLSIKLEQGAPPHTAAGVSAHKQNASPYAVSFLISEALGTSWPFVPNRDYYLLLTNTTASPIDSTLRMLGSSVTTEDEDTDELPDSWEITHFGNLLQTASGDYDGDGSTNLQEYENGTLPTNAASVLYHLDVLSHGGATTVSPLLANYPSGTQITLTARPAPGDSFRQWKSSSALLNGSTNALAEFAITANIQATALFQTSLANGLDASNSLAFTTYGNGSWFGQYEMSHDATDAVASPALSTNQQSRFTTTVTGPGTLSFWWKVSSRANSGKLTLLVDNVAQSSPAPISGTTADWALVTLEIPAGSHSLAWRYSRDATSLTDGDNRAYVDQLIFTRPAGTAFLTEHWFAAQFTPAELSSPTLSSPAADPDGDGMPNLIEAAIGTNPKSPNAAGTALTLVSTTIANGQRSTLLAARRSETPPENLVLTLQSTTSLTADTWTTLAQKSGSQSWISLAAGVSSPSESSATNGSVPVEITESAPTFPTTRFYRLVATSTSTP